MVNRLSTQVVGNVGLYYACYRLSLDGWNVMPAARNARGIGAVIYSQDATRIATLQIKALTRRNPVPLGNSLERLFGDWFVICRNLAVGEPECFVLTPAEVRALAYRREKGTIVSFWLQPRQYETPEFREAWHRIGSGLSGHAPEIETGVGDSLRWSSLTVSDFPERRRIVGFEGGAVYAGERDGKYYVLQDESAMAELLDEDDLPDEPQKTFEFDTRT
jgi:hypothetical protein